MQIISSDSIKSILIDLYDYQYKKYQSVDLLLDHKYYNELSPFITRSLGKISYGKIVLREMDLELVKINYSELSDQCGNVYLLTNASFQHLNNITKTVNLLLKLLNKDKVQTISLTQHSDNLQRTYEILSRPRMNSNPSVNSFGLYML